MNENRTMRKRVVELLRPLHAFAVENGHCLPGTPDVNCTLGWLELKATNHWPVQPGTVVKLDHDLTPQQRIWLLKRTQAGGRCWVLLTVARDWLLFRGDVAARHLGHETRERLHELAVRAWNRTPTTDELIECLSH